jgi:short-subunit dehydrogenase
VHFGQFPPNEINKQQTKTTNIYDRVIFSTAVIFVVGTKPPRDMLRKQGRSLLLAGGTDGIGYAYLVLECQRQKYNTIYVIGRNFHRIDTELLPSLELCDEDKEGRRTPTIIKLVCDITDKVALKQVIDQINNDNHNICTFVNTIGTYTRGTIMELCNDDDVVEQHFQLNCIANINLIRAVLPLLLKKTKKQRGDDNGDDGMGPQILICSASLALQARSPYALQSATKAGLKFFIDTLRIELKGQVRVMSILPPSVNTTIFAKGGDVRDTSNYPPAERVANAMCYMLDCPADISIPELVLEQHEFFQQETANNDVENNNRMEEKLPRYRNHDGYLVAYGFPVEGFNSALTYEAQDNDLFIVTYPKCGTTWTQHIIYLILNNGSPLQPDQRLDLVFPHLEEVGEEFIITNGTILGGYRLIKTHLPYNRVPKNSNAKYIFVSRNPKDCVVSFYHHTVGFPKHYDFANGKFDTYFNLFLTGKVDHGDYFDYLRQLMDHKDDPNVLFQRYENGRQNTREYVLQIASFLGSGYPEQLLADNEKILNLVLEHSSLDSMKKEPTRWCSDRTGYQPFIRRGATGEWDELLSKDQAAMLQNRLDQMFTKSELDFLGDLYH